MMLTSAQANNLLRQIREEKERLLSRESVVSTFVAATAESLEDARPAYDYAAVNGQLSELEEKIRRIKHCINVFNTTQDVPGFGMTVDQMLVYLPQMNARKNKLERMASHPPKVRQSRCSRSNLIEYEYVNYKVGQVEEDLKAITEAIAGAQFALEKVNTTVAFEVDLQ